MNQPNREKRAYARPEILSLRSDEVVEALGPAQGLTSGLTSGGGGTGTADRVRRDGRIDGRRFSRR